MGWNNWPPLEQTRRMTNNSPNHHIASVFMGEWGTFIHQKNWLLRMAKSFLMAMKVVWSPLKPFSEGPEKGGGVVTNLVQVIKQPTLNHFFLLPFSFK